MQHRAEPNRILYLVPAFPAVSETFVYREIAALQTRGKSISLAALYKGAQSPKQLPRLDRVDILYDTGALGHLGNSFRQAFRAPLRYARAKSLLLRDMIEVGLLSRNARALVYQFLAAGSLARVLLDAKVDHIHAHFAHSPTQLAMYASAMTGVPFTFTGHANDLFERGILLATKARRARCMVTISDFNRQYLLTQGVPEAKVRTIRVILDFPRRVPKARDPQAKLRLGTLGRLVGKKGMDTALSALGLMTDQELAGISLEIGGDGPLRNQLQAQADALVARGADVQLLGQMDPGEVDGWMGSLDGFVLACRQTAEGDVDGIPVVLMEAMAMGVPVISTRITGVPELIPNDRCGYLAPPEDPAALAAHFRQLLTQPEDALTRATAAQDHLFNEFSPQKNIDRLLDAMSREGD